MNLYYLSFEIVPRKAIVVRTVANSSVNEIGYCDLKLMFSLLFHLIYFPVAHLN